MKIFAIFAFVLSLNSYGAIKRPVDELAKYRTEVMEMGARLSTLEKEIGSKNNLYLSSLEQIKQFESDIKIYREELQVRKTEVQKTQLENKKILQNYLLEAESDSAEPWQKKVHLELLKHAQTKLSEKASELNAFETKVAEFEIKLLSLKSYEEELSQVIVELENRKKATMTAYLTKLETKKKVEKKVQTQSLKNKVAHVKKQMSNAPVIEIKPDRFFSKPVDDFLSFTASPKGVTFKFQAAQPVKAVGSGKIVFAGDLASYGQVVLIDHGKDLRTVLLGKMNIRVKKNDTVRDGDILGYTLNDSQEAQNLYFEVRKKNTAQNTILWLDQGGVSKI